MIEVSLTNNALLQLNILLWMSLPGRKEWINPFFYKKGFEIKAIEPELSLPPKIVDFLKRNNCTFERNPRPELLIINQKTKVCFLIECKNKAFDFNESENRKVGQALSFLSYNSNLLADDFGLEGSWEGCLGYILVDSNYVTDFYKAFNVIRERLLKKGIKKTNNIGVLYWQIRDNVLYLIVSNDNWDKIDLPAEIAVIRNLKDDNIHPLYLIPIDYNLSKDDLGYTVFYKRLKNQLIMFLGKELSVEEKSILNIEDVLQKVIPVWHIWRNTANKKFIRRKARDYINNLLNIIKINTKLDYHSVADGIKFPEIKHSELIKIRNYILNAEIRKDVFNKSFMQMSIYDKEE
jgi:hypothetical protein